MLSAVLLLCSAVQCVWSVSVLLPVSVPRALGVSSVLSFRYRCSRVHRVGVDVLVETELHPLRVLFRRSWPCVPSEEERSMEVSLSGLPAGLAFRPDVHSPLRVHPERSVLRTWLSAESGGEQLSHEVSVEWLPPWQRPSSPVSACLSWLWASVPRVHRPRFECVREEDRVLLLPSLHVLSGGHVGVWHRLSPFRGVPLEAKRRGLVSRPSFCLSTWLYLEEDACSSSLCSLFHVVSWNGTLLPPSLLVSPEGRVQVSMGLSSAEVEARMTVATLPRRRWLLLSLSVQGDTWSLLVRGQEGETLLALSYRLTLSSRWDDTAALLVLGGSGAVASLRGWLGRTWLSRVRVLDVWHPAPSSPSWADVSRTRCADWHVWLRRQTWEAASLLRGVLRANSCPARVWGLPPRRSRLPVCPPWAPLPDDPDERALILQLRRQLWDGGEWRAGLARWMRRQFLRRTDLSGLDPRLLWQGACLDDADSAYLLAALMRGLVLPPRHDEAVLLLHEAARRGHVLSLLALAFGHVHGVAPLPRWPSSALAYYWSAADEGNRQRQQHGEDGVDVELVRLSDDERLAQLTDEDGALLHWLRLQASRGVQTAQRHLATLHFWGSGGVKRDLRVAAALYEEEAKSQTPDAMANLGIVLLRGLGVPQQQERGRQLLQHAAEQGHVAAMATLGWHALVALHDYSQAQHWLSLAVQREGHRDAAHNLAFMWNNGLVPGKAVDKLMAAELHELAARKGNLDAGLAFSRRLALGLPHRPSDLPLALEWAQYVAERAPSVAKALRQALDAFRAGSWSTAILLYVHVAETGLEVAAFNAAFLCEDAQEHLPHALHCVWHYYNVSTLRSEQHVHPLALVKMADLHWYGCQGTRNLTAAVQLYARAASKGDPHALFSLALIAEEATLLDTRMHALAGTQQGDEPLLVAENLFRRCAHARHALVPCTLALWRVKAIRLYRRYGHGAQVLLGGAALVGVASCLRRRQ